MVTQHISKAYIDLQDVNEFVLPIGVEPLQLASILKHKFISFKDLTLHGNLNQVNIEAMAIESNYEVESESSQDQMQLTKKTTGWSMLPVKEIVSPLIINEFKLGSFLKQEQLGIVAGDFSSNCTLG